MSSLATWRMLVAWACIFILTLTQLIFCAPRPKDGQGSVGKDASAPTDTRVVDTPKDTSTEATKNTSTEAAKNTNPATVSVVMVGDILLHDNVNAAYLQSDGSYDYTALFAQVADEIASKDLAIVNQETPLGGAESGYDLQLITFDDGSYMPVFNSPDAVADAEAAVGFDVILKAQNHVFDQGYDGITHELTYWTTNYPDIAVVGVADPAGTSGAPDYVNDDVYIYEKDGFKVAVLNYTGGVNLDVTSRDSEVVAFWDNNKIKNDVAKARAKGADMVIVCPHWGIEYDTVPYDENVEDAQYLADLGVDVIFGTHPHAIQPVEVVTGKGGNTCVCFYSNGNFTTGTMRADTMISALSEVTFERDADGTCRIVDASFKPVVVHGGTGDDMTTYLLPDYTDALAATNWVPELTPEYVTTFCEEVLGSDFDPATGELRLQIS